MSEYNFEKACSNQVVRLGHQVDMLETANVWAEARLQLGDAGREKLDQVEHLKEGAKGTYRMIRQSLRDTNYEEPPSSYSDLGEEIERAEEVIERAYENNLHL